MNRATSSVVSIASRDGASVMRSSRSGTIEPLSTGSARRQSELVVRGAAVWDPALGGVLATISAVEMDPSQLSR
jgi:hypothetical protein